MSRFYIPTNDPEDWRLLLAKPDLHWKPDRSAQLLAYCWHQANDFPRSVRGVFTSSGIRLFQDLELLLAFPEYKVSLRGGKRASQNDIFILAKGNDELVSITVEGKVDESFGETVARWKYGGSKGKEERLNFLCGQLQLVEEQVDHIRYQLLHRTASALIEAKRFKAENALMLVHSFSQENEEDDKGFKDYCEFLALFGKQGEMNSLMPAKKIEGISLFFGWVSEKLICLE